LNFNKSKDPKKPRPELRGSTIELAITTRNKVVKALKEKVTRALTLKNLAHSICKRRKGVNQMGSQEVSHRFCEKKTKNKPELEGRISTQGGSFASDQRGDVL